MPYKPIGDGKKATVGLETSDEFQLASSESVYTDSFARSTNFVNKHHEGEDTKNFDGALTKLLSNIGKED